MKRIRWSIACVIIAFIGTVEAQQLGVTAGYNIANLNGIKSASAKHGLTVGGYLHYDLGGWAIQPEVLFSMKGASGEYMNAPGVASTQYDWTLNYIEVPILLKFDVLDFKVLPVDVDLYAGPDFAFNVASRNQSTTAGLTTATSESGNTHPFDFNIAVGGGPNLYLGPITLGVELRYEFGTTPVLKNADAAPPFQNWTNGTWSIMASVGL